MEVSVYIFGFKAAVLIVTDIDGGNVPTEVNNIIISHQSTTQAMVDPHCKILWADKSGEGLGLQPTDNYG